MSKIFFKRLSFNVIVFGLVLSFFSCKPHSALDENLMETIEYKKSTPEWAKKSNIYEVNIRQFTPEGTFKAFQNHLPRLKKMGVEILWLMPIHPIGEKNRKGKLGSYYSISNYQAVNPEFGTLDDFKSLVAEAHRLDMHVIIDWVANHTSWDNVWIKEHSDWYTQDSLGNIIVPAGTDWDDTADLNYDNPNLRKAMIESMLFWVKNADIDGFRCDVAGMIPIDFWIHARKAIDQEKSDCFFLAEASEPELHKAFDMTYNWQLKDIVNNIAKGKNDVNDLIKHFENESKLFNKDDLRMQFITNHDENTWSGSEYERLGTDPVDAFTVLTYTLPGMALTYNGQEEPLTKRLRFFDKDTIVFKNYARNELITKLNKLKSRSKALTSLSYKEGFLGLRNSEPKSILSFIRKKRKKAVACVFNFTPKEQKFIIKDEIAGEFLPYVGEDIQFVSNKEITLKAWSYSVLVKEK